MTTVARTLIALGLALVVALAGSPADAAPAPSGERGSLEASNGKPRNARITILARGIKRLPVIAYRGWTDDAPGVFRYTPSLRNGTRILVDAGRYRYVYRVVKTRWVSFRSAKSLRAQRAEVPGEPGKKATRAWLTLSTCATPEDRARGNDWTDRFGNPEHRIDKIGLMVNRVKNPYWQPKKLQ